jgi:hypothetical protein
MVLHQFVKIGRNFRPEQKIDPLSRPGKGTCVLGGSDPGADDPTDDATDRIEDRHAPLEKIKSRTLMGRSPLEKANEECERCNYWREHCLKNLDPHGQLATCHLRPLRCAQLAAKPSMTQPIARTKP